MMQFCATADLIQGLPYVKIGVAPLSLPLAFEDRKTQEEKVNELVKTVCI